MKVKISLVIVFATLVAATWAYGDGFNMVSWPLIPHDTAIQPAMADSMGSGCQVTGGYPSANSDELFWYDGVSTWYSAWYKIGGLGGSYIWKGTMTTIDPDRGYWIKIKGTHPAVTLTMTGSVNTAARSITVQPGPSFNFLGSAFAESRPINDGTVPFAGSTGDNCGLLASGFTGGYPSSSSDEVLYFDGTTWYNAWYKIGGLGASYVWKGTLASLDPGNGFIINVKATHAFTGNTWDYIANPAKGAKVVVDSKTRTPERTTVAKKLMRTRSSSTDQSLGRTEAVESKKSR